MKKMKPWKYCNVTDKVTMMSVNRENQPTQSSNNGKKKHRNK